MLLKVSIVCLASAYAIASTPGGGRLDGPAQRQCRPRQCSPGWKRGICTRDNARGMPVQLATCGDAARACIAEAVAAVALGRLASGNPVLYWALRRRGSPVARRMAAGSQCGPRGRPGAADEPAPSLPGPPG